MPVATTDRVETNTQDSLNAEFQERLKANIAKYADATNAEIDQRLKALDREWSVERIIETEAPTMIGLGAVLGSAEYLILRKMDNGKKSRPSLPRTDGQSKNH